MNKKGLGINMVELIFCSFFSICSVLVRNVSFSVVYPLLFKKKHVGISYLNAC